MFKEAVQKMPRQFAPQSLYNMMGKHYGIKGRKIREAGNNIQTLALPFIGRPLLLFSDCGQTSRISDVV